MTIANRKYSASRGGHAPGNLCGALRWTLDNLSPREPWWAGLADEQVLDFDNQQMQARWNKWTSRERGRWLCGQLWNCTDIMPGSACDALDIPHGTTYARAVRKLKVELDTSG